MKNGCKGSFIWILSLVFCLGIADSAWAVSPETDFIFDASTGTITGYTGPGGAVEIPATIGGANVSLIGNNAFRFCTSITGMTIPSGVTSIGYNSFLGCSSLTSMKIPDTVLSLRDGAFAICSSLPNITIPGSVTLIGSSTFAGCDALTSIYIPGNVTAIGEYAFSTCKSLVEILVDPANPNYSSADGVLFNYDKTTLVEFPGGKSGNYSIPTGVITIGTGAFIYCRALTGVTIPTTVTSIGYQAFYNCNSLDGITIPDSVTSIKLWAFSECTSLTGITIPGSVTSIEGYAFNGCTSLTEISVNPSNPNYSSADGVLFNHDKTTLLEFPGGKGGAYTIPGTVTSFGSWAFISCNLLTSVTIPESVNSIGYQAFYKCSSLAVAYFKGNAPVSFAANVPLLRFVARKS